MILGGCSSSGSETVTGPADDLTKFFEYSTAEFAIQVPNEWETVNAFTSEYPESVRVAFRDNLKDGDFTANVVVTRENNGKSLTSMDFAQKTLGIHGETLISYRLISQENLELGMNGGASATVLNTFEGKKEADAATLNFQQVYLTKGEQAWTVTASYLPNEDEFTVARMETMLKSFRLK